MKVAFFTRFPEDVAAPRGGIETVTLALTKTFADVDDIELHVVTMEPGLKSLSISQQLGATIHRLPGSRCPQILDVLGGPGRKRLKRYLSRLDPDIVHFHETYGLGIGDLPMPYVVTIHGFDHANIPAERRPFAWLRAPLWRRVEERGLARLRHIISITPYVRNHITPLTNAQIYDIDNPIDASFFDVPRQEVRGRVLFAGWISQRKNPLGLVQAFAKMVEQGGDGTLHIAGEESEPAYAQKLRETIKDLRLTDRVHLLGRISPTDMRRQLSEASVFVLPSFQENSPMAIEEAMAVGIPVISTNLCGMPFMIREDETGYLTPPGDCQALAERLTRLSTDDALRSRMGQSAKEEALRRFHPATVVDKTKKVYEGILGGSN